MHEDLPTAVLATVTPADQPLVVDDDGGPTWFDDENPLGRKSNWFGKLKRPAAAAAMIFVAGTLWLIGWRAVAISVSGVVALGVGFAAGVFFLRKALSGSHPVVGVARAVVEEAISTRLTVLLVMLVMVSLPILPLLLDPSERLAYRVQFFLSWSLSGSSVLLALVTIALCCSSVCGDIDSYRIHLSLCKPMRRWEYLFGKWLGVILLNLLLVMLVGIGVYAVALALAYSPAADAADRLAVDEQVLTARASASPMHPRGEEFEESVLATIEEIRKDDPATFAKDPVRAKKRVMSQRVHEWHTVTADSLSSFVFHGLDNRQIQSTVVQLRLEPFADNSSISRADVRFALWLNERPFPIRKGRHVPYTLTTGMVHTINLPTSAIAEDGGLKVTIANRNLVMPGETQPTSISLTPGQGLQVLYRVGAFGPNFVRGLLVIWAKLVMLAATALAAGSWLGFPTAFLASLMVYVAAVANAFFADAIDIYTGIDRQDASVAAIVKLRLGMLLGRMQKAEWWEAIKTIGSYFADAFLALIPSFGHYDSISQISTGRVISLAESLSGVLVLGVAYPLVLLLIGCVLLERRDLVSTAS